MRRIHHTFPFLVVLLLGCFGLAQKVELRPGGTVAFEPTRAELLESIGCAPERCLAPAPASPEVQLSVVRQRPGPFRVEVRRTAWTPREGMRLWARYAISRRNSEEASRTEWIVLDAGTTREVLAYPDDAPPGRNPNLDVAIEYRVEMLPQATAGFYSVDVEYATSRGSTSHRIEVGVPPLLDIRFVGVSVGATPVVRFDYASDLESYLQAIETGEPLAVTGANFDRLEVFSNYPGGYLVTLRASIEVPPNPGTAGGVELDDLRLFGLAASGARFAGGPTEGYETILMPEDFGFRVEGDEVPGAYRVELSYEVEPGP